MDKEKLEKFLLYIVEVANSPENEWFKAKLINSLNSGSSEKVTDFGSYFRLLKVQLRLKANHFYQNILNKKLKDQLIKDCLNMYWYQLNNDVIQQFNYTFFQFENLLNYYADKSGINKKIENNPSKYRYEYSYDGNTSPFAVNCDKDISRPINKIGIWTKVVYWAIDTNEQEFLKKNHSNITTLINFRNQNLHRNSLAGIKLPSQIDNIKKQDFSHFGYYIKILKKILDSCAKIEIS